MYAEISVFQNQGIDELIHNVIENCIILERSLIAHSLTAIEKIKSNTSTPTVGSVSTRIFPSPMRMRRLVLPVPESPIMIILNCLSKLEPGGAGRLFDRFFYAI